MARTAEYSIKGYIYQFLQYMAELLEAADDEVVVIEGAIEDIDVIGPDLTRAVQCKYHESVEKFTLSKIYKPVLLMMEHFSKNQAPAIPISYNLFCHFPEQAGNLNLTIDDLTRIRQTKDEKLKPIADRILAFPVADFLERFSITFGKSFDELEAAVQERLVDHAFQREDVKSIIYPAAFQRVADISIRGTVAERSMQKAPFLLELRAMRSATLTRWTRELATKADIYRRLRLDIGRSMARNARRRFFVLDPSAISGFTEDFAPFIKRFSESYCFKYLHPHAPVFVLILPTADVDDLVDRVDEIKIVVNDGKVGSGFKKDRFLRDPIVKRVNHAPAVRDFEVSICSNHDLSTFEGVTADDVFIVNADPTQWKVQDRENYVLEVESLRELEYLLKLRGAL